MEYSVTQRRGSPRFPLLAKPSVILDVDCRPCNANIFDYGLGGFGLLVPPIVVRQLKRQAKDVVMLMGSTSLPSRITHFRDDKNNPGIGLEVLVNTAAHEPVFRSTDKTWDRIEDSASISAILEDLAFKGPEILIELRQAKYSEHAYVKEVMDHAQIRLEIVTRRSGTTSDSGPLQCQFTLYQTAHLFVTRVDKTSGNEIIIDVPRQIVRLLRRKTFRVLNEGGKFIPQITFESSILGSFQDGIRIQDFCEGGISVLDTTGRVYAPIGMPFESVKVSVPGNEAIYGNAIVRTQRQVGDKGYSIGMEFRPASYEERTKWHNAVLTSRYPTLNFNYQLNDHGQIWSLYERSGYLAMKPRESFTHLVDITKGTWESLARAGTGLSKRLIIRGDQGVIGHMQLDRIYPRAWCAHGLAIDPKLSKVVAGQIYAATADILTSENAAYLYTITNAALPWNQRNYYDFVSKYPFPEHNELRTFFLHEADMSVGWELEGLSELHTRPANHYDLRRIARFYELYGSDIERHALGFDFEHLTLATLQNDLKAYGLYRKREFVVGTVDDRFVGFGLVESGTTGVSLFGMQYTVYIHLLPDIGELKDRLYEGLLKETLELVKNDGIRNVNIYMQENRREHYEKKGLRYIEEAIRWISNCTAARRYTAFTHMIYGHLLLRRERTRAHVRERS